MLAHAKDVQSYLVGQFHGLDEILQSPGRADALARYRVWRQFGEGIEANLKAGRFDWLGQL
jgi:hypothetical protein